MFRRNVLFPSSATKNRPNNQYAVLIIQQSRWFHIPEDRKTCTVVAVRTSNPTSLHQFMASPPVLRRSAQKYTRLASFKQQASCVM